MYCVCGWGQTQASGVNNFLACTFFLRICFFLYLYLFVFLHICICLCFHLYLYLQLQLLLVGAKLMPQALYNLFACVCINICLKTWRTLKIFLKRYFRNIAKKIVLLPRFYSIYSDEAKQSAVKRTTGTLELLFFVN